MSKILSNSYLYSLFLAYNACQVSKTAEILFKYLQILFLSEIAANFINETDFNCVSVEYGRDWVDDYWFSFNIFFCMIVFVVI